MHEWCLEEKLDAIQSVWRVVTCLALKPGPYINDQFTNSSLNTEYGNWNWKLDNLHRKEILKYYYKTFSRLQ